jgi:uncharacterized protein (TIGR02466 family)
MNVKFFNPVPIAKVQVEQTLLSKIDQLSTRLFTTSSTVEDYPVNHYLTIRGGEQRRVWPCNEDRSWLTDWIESQAKEYQQSAGIDLSLTPKLANCWTITQPENSYQVTHTHPYGSISGNLYLEIPNFKNDSAETDGCISFLFDPSSDPKATRFLHITPTVGTLLIFPSWLPHQVYPWQGIGNRRVLAWDCQLLPQ